MAKVFQKRRLDIFSKFGQSDRWWPLYRRDKNVTYGMAHHEAGQTAGLSNPVATEQPTFGPQRYPKSAASCITEGWLNMRQQLFVRIVVFSMRNQPELSK